MYHDAQALEEGAPSGSSTLTDDLEQVLTTLGELAPSEETGELLPQAYTAEALASAAGLPLTVVRNCLGLLANSDRVRSRMHRSGPRLYYLSELERAARAGSVAR